MPTQQTSAATTKASWIAPASAALRTAAVGAPPPISARWTGSRVATIAPLRAIPTAWPLTRIWASVPDAVPTRGRGTEPSTALLLGLMNMP